MNGRVHPAAAWLLLLALFGSALAVVWLKQQGRTLLAQRQQLTSDQERLRVEYDQLRLELGTFGAHGRVEALARNRLNMRDPDGYTILQAPES